MLATGLDVFHLLIIFHLKKKIENGLITLKTIASQITADISSPWHFVKTHLNAPELQTSKTAFIEVLTLADGQSISQHLAALNCYRGSEGVLSFSCTAWKFCYSFW